MRVTYLLEGTELFGGVKVALRQANLLCRRGHEVTVLAKGPEPEWLPVEARFEQVAAFDDLSLPADELCVATYWTTIETAARSGAVALHFCQGYEGSYTHNEEDHSAIEAAYRTPIPAMTVAPHLTEMIESRFKRPARTVLQPLEGLFRPARFRRRPATPPRILVVGPVEIDWKGVETGLRAVAELRRRGLECRLLRISQWPLTDEEREITPPDEEYVGVPPAKVAEVMETADLLLAPSWEQEGFGLPVLEAMASGVPVVGSDIPPFRWFGEDAVVVVPPRAPTVMAKAALGLLSDPRGWRGRRRAGISASRKFRGARPARDVERALGWALEGADG